MKFTSATYRTQAIAVALSALVLISTSCSEEDVDFGLDPVQAASILAKADGTPWDSNGGRLSYHVDWRDYGYQEITIEEPFKSILDYEYDKGFFQRMRSSGSDYYVMNPDSRDWICSIASIMYSDCFKIELIVFSRKAVKSMEERLKSYGMVKVDKDGYKPDFPVFVADYCFIYPNLKSVGIVFDEGIGIEPQTRNRTIPYYKYSVTLDLNALNFFQSEYMAFDEFSTALKNALRFRELYQGRRITLAGKLSQVVELDHNEYMIYLEGIDSYDTLVIYSDNILSNNLKYFEIGDIIHVSGNISGMYQYDTGVEMDYVMFMK